VILLVLSAVATAGQTLSKSTVDDQVAVQFTVYNSNLGLIKDTRKIALPLGEGELRFMDVASHIMPVTVHAKSLNRPNDFSVLEKNYEYDLMNAEKLLDKYVGKKINYNTIRILFKWLNRRSQRLSYNWAGFKDLLTQFAIPAPKITEKYPSKQLKLFA